MYVELTKIGAKLTAGTSFGTVESVKAVSEIYAPVSGEVSEINASLGAAPELINTDPHGQAWLIKLKNADASEIASLMDSSAYQRSLRHREKKRNTPA